MNSGTPSVELPAAGATSPRQSGPLVWHPAIRALFWLDNWAVFAGYTAVVWQFLATGDFYFIANLVPMLARVAWLLLALALLFVVLLVFEFWWSLVLHARRQYARPAAIRLILVESLVVSVPLALYAWFVTWALGRAYRLVPGWTGGLLRTPKSKPSWLVALLLTALSAWLLWEVGGMLRVAVRKFSTTLRLLGAKRFLKGLLIMALLRLRQPRKDFFQQAPGIGLLPWLAVCVVLYAEISFVVFAWVLPVLVLAYGLMHQISMVRPPAWLFLGTSTFASFRLFHDLRATWWPRDGVTLLDREGREGSSYYVAEAAYRVRQGSFGHRFFNNPAAPRVWSLRTRPALWEHTVWLLIQFVPVVIVDLQAASEYVRQEIKWLAEAGRLERAWFLASAGDQVSLPDGLPPELLAAVAERVVTEEELCAASWDRSGLRLGADTGSAV
jgi:hypothetical protein